MGNLISYYTGNQDFRIGYPSGGSIVKQIYKFRLHSVDFQASNVSVSNGWTVSSVSDGGSYYDVTFAYEPSGTPTNLDLTTLALDEMLVASLDTSISQLSDTTQIDWWTDKDSASFDTSTNSEGILIVKNSAYGGAGGDPHIKPIIGRGYDLPHVQDTFLLYSNNNSEYPVSIKTKCWFLPKDKYMRYVNKMEQNGYYDRAIHHKRLFERGTYFKYIEILSGDEHIIFDMESLSLCEFTSLDDVDNFTLPSMRKYEGNGAIRISKIKKANKGILGKKASENTLERKVYIYSPKAIISLRLLKDARNITTRNGIEFFVNKGFYGDTGALVRKEITHDEFGKNYHLFNRNAYKIYKADEQAAFVNGEAVSYGNLTEDNVKEYSYETHNNYTYEDDSDANSLLKTNTDMILDSDNDVSFIYETDDDTISEVNSIVVDSVPYSMVYDYSSPVKEKKEEPMFVTYDYSSDAAHSVPPVLAEKQKEEQMFVTYDYSLDATPATLVAPAVPAAPVKERKEEPVFVVYGEEEEQEPSGPMIFSY